LFSRSRIIPTWMERGFFRSPDASARLGVRCAWMGGRADDWAKCPM